MYPTTAATTTTILSRQLNRTLKQVKTRHDKGTYSGSPFIVIISLIVSMTQRIRQKSATFQQNNSSNKEWPPPSSSSPPGSFLRTENGILGCPLLSVLLFDTSVKKKKRQKHRMRSSYCTDLFFQSKQRRQRGTKNMSGPFPFPSFSHIIFLCFVIFQFFICRFIRVAWALVCDGYNSPALAPALLFVRGFPRKNRHHGHDKDNTFLYRCVVEYHVTNKHPSQLLHR